MTSGLFTPVSVGGAAAAKRLVIAVSPSVRLPVEALARAFEATHPGVTVQLSVTSDPELRQIMAALYHAWPPGGGEGGNPPRGTR